MKNIFFSQSINLEACFLRRSKNKTKGLKPSLTGWHYGQVDIVDKSKFQNCHRIRCDSQLESCCSEVFEIFYTICFIFYFCHSFFLPFFEIFGHNSSLCLEIDLGLSCGFLHIGYRLRILNICSCFSNIVPNGSI